MSESDAQQLWSDLAAAAGLGGHFHVVTTRQDALTYTEDLSEADAVSFADGLMDNAPADFEAVWIVESPASCPLAHGDDEGDDDQRETEFLGRVMDDEPYWRRS